MRYNSLNNHLKETFGSKVYKLALNGGMTCPNRDGTLGSRGCIFCSEGSGSFTPSPQIPISEQIETARSRLSKKISGSCKFIAYFQAYTNTYASVEYLEKIFSDAIDHPDIIALSAATRPDCIQPDILRLLCELNKIKPVWIELGLQSIHKVTAEYIRRGYSLDCFEDAAYGLRSNNINFIVHIILGLPGETEEMMLDTVKYTGNCGASGIKIQLLHVLEGTDLAADYKRGLFDVLDFAGYVDLAVKSLEILPPEMVIHRLTGDGPKSLLLAPLWSSDKRPVLQAIERRLEELDTFQGKLYKK